MAEREGMETAIYGREVLRKAASLFGYAVRAADGDVGKVDDLYFDDAAWTVRYFVVDTGTWLSGRLVLLSPAALAGRPDHESKEIPVTLTREQVRSSPEAEEHKPVSRQYEMDIAVHYGWPMYWTFGGFYNIAPPPPAYETEREERYAAEEQDPHLRSMREVTGYRLQAIDGEIGHIDDFLVDDGDWGIRYMIVDTRTWLPGRRVLLAPRWISDISWEERKVYVDFTTDEIRSSPEYDPSAPVTAQYEKELHQHYGAKLRK